jgi:hypothetical protein
MNFYLYLFRHMNTFVLIQIEIFELLGYQALPWVRYITTNGNYQLRMS